MDHQRHWAVAEEGPAEGVGLMPSSVYAQNDVYLEFCNPAWNFQWKAVFGSALIVPLMFLVIWVWYGFAVHPVLFDRVIIFW